MYKPKESILRRRNVGLSYKLRVFLNLEMDGLGGGPVGPKKGALS